MTEDFYYSVDNEEEQEQIITTTDTYLDGYIKDLAKAKKLITAHKGLRRKIITDKVIVRLYETWCEKFGFKISQIKEHLDFQESSLSESFKTSYSFRELMQASRDTGEWLVPSYFQPAAFYLCFGDPKGGKTTFILDLKYSILVSGIFLGMPVKKGKVLDFSLEEGVSLSAMKMIERGFEDDDASYLNYSDIYRIEKSFNLLEDIPKLEQMIYDFKPSLVTFDSLRMMLAGTGISENSAEISPLMYRLHQVFIKSGFCTGLLIHHANKSGKGVGKASGHSSIASANDGLFNFSKFKNDSGQTRGLMETFPRNGVARTVVLNMVKSEGGRWALAIESEKDLDPAIEAWSNRIIRVLTSKPYAQYSSKDLKKKLGVSNCSEYEDALIRLREMCIIEVSRVDKQFIYSIPESSAWFDNESSLLAHISTESRLADSLVKCKTRQDLRILSKNWSLQLKQSVVKLLSDEERQFVVTLSNTCPYSKGDSVVYNGLVLLVTDTKLDEKERIFYFQLEDNGDEWICEDNLSLHIEEETIEEKAQQYNPQDQTLF